MEAREHLTAINGKKQSKNKVKSIIITSILPSMIVILGLIIYNFTKTVQNNSEIVNNLSNRIKRLENQSIQTRMVFDVDVHKTIIYLKIIILKQSIDPELAKKITNSIYKWSKAYNRDPNLLIALIHVESNFDPSAVSPAGAQGLTQIMGFWYEIFKEPTDKFFEIDSSIKYGCQILELYEKQYGNLDMALTAYNRGHHRIETDIINGKDPHNGYASKIMNIYKRLEEIDNEK